MKKFISLVFTLLLSFSLNAQVETVESEDTGTSIEPKSFTYTDEAVHALKILESYQSKVYYDRNDNLIFGYGHLVLDKELASLKRDFGYEAFTEDGSKEFVQPTNELSEAEKKKIIEEYLRKDIDVVLAKMKQNIKVPLEQHQIDALVIYLFWRGPNEQNAEVKELYGLINSEDDKAVADFIANRPKKDKTYLPGNQRRNKKTADLYITGNHPFWD
jgi:GH24 family phage-related lysozyme (muramidase)